VQKPLPPATWAALSPPANAAFPYTFFVDAADHAVFPFVPNALPFNLGNAWVLMDAAFLAYSGERVISDTWKRAVPDAQVRYFSGRTTECYVASTANWIVLAWRGTQVDDFWSSVLDWLTDARFFPIRDADGHFVHSGFLDAIGQVWAGVRAHIAGLQQASRRPLWITGHSLGAALATIAANRCSHDPALGHVGTYTFGSPRVGDPGFGQQIGTPVFRVQNNTDLVTHLPLGLIYDHVGEREFIDAGGHLHPGFAMPAWLLPLDPHVIGQLRHLVAGRLIALPAVPGVLADHAPINYATLLWNIFDRSPHT
jgi:triacylglycerol lipase